jgi:hypothetical protein
MLRDGSGATRSCILAGARENLTAVNISPSLRNMLEYLNGMTEF